MASRIYSKEHKKLISRLISARKNAGLNQTNASKLLGRTQTYLSKIEVGQRKIDALELKKLAKIYDLPPAYFLE